MWTLSHTLTHRYKPEFDTSTACIHWSKSREGTAWCGKKKFEHPPRGPYTQRSGQLSQRRIHTYTPMNSFIVSLCSLHSWTAQWSNISLSSFPSSLFTTLRFHTSLLLTQVSPASHMSCPLHIKARVCVQAGLNRLQQLPKQSLFQMKHTFGAPFILSFYFHLCRSAECIGTLGKHHPSILQKTLKTPFFPYPVSSEWHRMRNAYTVCLWLKATKINANELSIKEMWTFLDKTPFVCY